MHDELKWNKLFGAVLGTGLAILLLRQGAEMAFATKPAAKPGYAVAVQEQAAEGAGAEAADTLPDWGTVLASADVGAGATISGKCQSCHNFASGGPNLTGPNLYGVEGRKPASHPGFAYSAGMTAEGEKAPVWSYDELYKFLAGPQAYVGGTKMSFVGLKKREDRINIIAWLKTQGGTLPVPAPDPSRAVGAAPAGAAGSAPAPDAGTTVPAAAGAAANAPVAVDGAAPANDTTSSASGVTPASGAAAAPSEVRTTNPGGSSPAEPTSKAPKPKR